MNSVGTQVLSLDLGLFLISLKKVLMKVTVNVTVYCRLPRFCDISTISNKVCLFQNPYEHILFDDL